jgi:hypothetical protein
LADASSAGAAAGFAATGLAALASDFAVAGLAQVAQISRLQTASCETHATTDRPLRTARNVSGAWRRALLSYRSREFTYSLDITLALRPARRNRSDLWIVRTDWDASACRALPDRRRARSRREKILASVDET